MGTTWQVKLAAPAPTGVRAAIEAALDGVIAQMSTWEPASEISAYNRAAAGAWSPISPDFAAVLATALQVAALSDGAFDPTLGDAVGAWGFGPATEAALPHDGTSLGGWRALTLEADRLRQPGGVQLDLSAIAKGFAVDKVASILAAEGVGSALVEIGGEIRAWGLKPDGEPWWVEVESPRPGWDAWVMIALPGWAAATSGDYRRWREVDGRRLAHTFDPQTRRPLAQSPASVTVLAASCMRADAWATALMVLGADRGLKLADAQDVAALFLLDDGDGVQMRASAAWRALEA